MRVRRTLAPLAAVLALTLAAAGCGRANAPTDDDGAAATGEVAADGEASGEIEIWTADGHGDNLTTLAQGFLDANPDASLKVTDVPWDQIITKAQTAAAAGTGPDIIMAGADQTAAVIGTGALAPMPDGVIDEDDFYPAAIASVTGPDGLYGVPWYVETRFIFYRADIAEDLGLSAPTTWDEMEAMSAAFKARDGGTYGMTLPKPVENPAQVIVPFVSQAGGAMTDGEKWTIDTPEFIQAMDFYTGFFTRGEAPLEGGDSDATFENGGTPMFISGPWMLDTYEQEIEDGVAPDDFTMDDVGYAVAPSGPAGNNDQYIGGGNLGVFTDSDNAASAWSLLKWLEEQDQQEQWYDLNGELPALTAAADYEPIQSNPVTSVLMDQMQHTIETPSYPAWSQIADLIGTYSERVANGEISSADAASEIQEKADSIGFGW
ncbi:MAG: extracellular solute-binding protein [Microbacterium sp.]